MPAGVAVLFLKHLLASPAVDIAIDSTVALGRYVAILFRVRALRATLVVYVASVHPSSGLGLANRQLPASVLSHAELRGR